MNLRDIFLAGAFAQGGGGAVSPEQIEQAVNSYLDKNPVESYTLPVANTTTLGGVQPVTATSDMTQAVGVDANGKLFTKPGESGVDLAMTGAAVGQIAKITAVDGNGVPTAWEPVDMPSGGGGSGAEEIVTETVEVLTIPAGRNALITGLSKYKEFVLIVAIRNSDATADSNEAWVFNDSGNRIGNGWTIGKGDGWLQATIFYVKNFSNGAFWSFNKAYGTGYFDQTIDSWGPHWINEIPNASGTITVRGVLK